MSLVSGQPGITLAELIHHAKGVTPDDIYFMIAHKVIYVDLTAEPLVEAKRCSVFADQLTAKAYTCCDESQATDDIITSPLIDIVPGTQVSYDGNILTNVLVGENCILLETENKEPTELEWNAFDNLVRLGKISSIKNEFKSQLSVEKIELLSKASEQDLKEANDRYFKIKPYLNGQPITANTEQVRSLRNWLQKYHKAQQKYGYGYLGLIHFANTKGNRSRKLNEFSIETIDKFITEDYETKKQKRKQATYNMFVAFCSNAGIPDSQIPSYKTFINEIKRRSGYEQIQKREGSRAAYPLEPCYWEIELTTPRHGEFPLHIGHIDHTELDIDLRCSRTGKSLGRPWVTFLLDAFTRRILAVYLTYDPPSYRSCMMVLRICVKRYGRIPQIIITDNGKEFHSTYFETLMALCECTLKHRPAGKPRFSAICERLFGTTNTQFVYSLQANTQIRKKVRLMTKSVNPEELSLWPLGLLYLYLCEWSYEIYDTTEHSALEGHSPQEAYIAGLAQFGRRDHKRIPYDDNFHFLTLPTTKQGEAKVHPNKGVKINYKYYWASAFRAPQVVNTYVSVRYEPFNAGIAYAYVRGIWVKCISEYYTLFQGHSEKEIELASAELKKRHKNYASKYKMRAKHLGEFITSAEAGEKLLKQRLCDEQNQEVFQVIEGGLPNLYPYKKLPEVNKDIDHEKRRLPIDSVFSQPVDPSKLTLFKSY
ncbi:transposase family protein [uncultured Nostoc sp.]|uniref:integrase catalytic domain-containing protein n=1 Tax=uncultured Nostoc sp. TaxID=340711 RepID=UPI0035C9D426